MSRLPYRHVHLLNDDEEAMRLASRVEAIFGHSKGRLKGSIWTLSSREFVSLS